MSAAGYSKRFRSRPLFLSALLQGMLRIANPNLPILRPARPSLRAQRLPDLRAKTTWVYALMAGVLQ
jgi:hypothetical protein